MEGLVLMPLLGVVGVLFLCGPLFLIIGFWRAATTASIRDRGGKPKSPWLLLFAGTVITILDLLAISALSSINFTKGRLLRIDGRARLPRRKLGPSATQELTPNLSGLSSWERTCLAELWLQSARMEQASVPAFSALSLRLTALGAPLELSERALHAAIDEIDHARRCYALAQAYSGLPWVAGPIPELLSNRIDAAAGDSAAALRRLAVGSLRDGCLAEALAARVAAEGAELARDPAIKTTLQTIARDERVHAELGWDVVRWCLSEGGTEVERALASTIATLTERRAPEVPRVPGATPQFLQAHGLPPQATLERLAEEEVRDVQEQAATLLTT